LPSTGEIAGTPLYLPPEAITGGVIDARSDLYSLGCMAYELATGKPPFLADSIMELLRKHVNEKPLPIRELNPDIPEGLERVIMKLLDKDAEYRYQSTAELINELIKISGYKEVVETVEQKKSYLNCAELIGREKEMQFLKDAFEEVRKGKGKSIFIGAPAGTGKSRLVQEFQLYVQLNEVPFVQGKCYEHSMQSYQPLAEALKSLLPLIKKRVLDKYGAVLAKVIPELRSKGYTSPAPLDEMGEKVRLFENVTGWLKEVSEITPIVIYIEDLHWADYPSIELLNASIRELQDCRIMFLASLRDDEVEATSSILHTVEEGVTKMFKLTPLQPNHVDILIKKMLGRSELTEDFVERLFTATGGNPFFISETMRILIEEEQLKLQRGRWILTTDIRELELPTSIESTIIQRLKRLSPEALHILQIASVVGKSVDLLFLKEISKWNEDKLFNFFDELIERQFLQVDNKKYIFTHDRVRETLYNQLEENIRKEIHEKVGKLIEKRVTVDKKELIFELAYHFSCGLNKNKAVNYLLQAANVYRQTGDIFGVTNSLKKVLKLLEDIEYPNKRSLLFHVRDQLIQVSYVTETKFCVEICELQFKELSKLINVPRVVKVLRWIFKIIDLLPEKLSIRIKVALSPTAPKERVEKDFSSILLLIIRTCGFWNTALIFIGETKKAWKIRVQVEKDFLPDLNGPGWAYLYTGGFIAIHEYLMKPLSYMEKFPRAFRILELIAENIGWRDAFGRQIYGLSLFTGNQMLCWEGRDWYDREMQNKAIRYNEEHRLFDILFWAKTNEILWFSYRGMYKHSQKWFIEAGEILRKISRPLLPEVWFYFYKSLAKMLICEYESAEE
ncbi:MAG: AAA family ATPase, partial [Candidatus Omnitrophica bacterium]|nr:AAA family ATPase [Candidatus Omnitrophota bacterium]